jgi:hypothetical protein
MSRNDQPSVDSLSDFPRFADARESTAEEAAADAVLTGTRRHHAIDEYQIGAGTSLNAAPRSEFVRRFLEDQYGRPRTK